MNIISLSGQDCREKFSVGGEDGRETEIGADIYLIYEAPPKFSECCLDCNDNKTFKI